MIKENCRCCNSSRLKSIIDLGKSPLANNLLDLENQHADLYPLEVMYCDVCHNCQLSHVVPPEKMFDTYLYVSSTTKTFREHFEKAAIDYVRDYKLTRESIVVDIGSNDGVALSPLKKLGITVVGVEPAKNIANIANNNGINTINSYFDEKTKNLILKSYGEVAIVTASNVFAHSDHLAEMTKNVFDMLKPSGVFIIEVQYLVDTIKDMTFDNIYHEHVNYWSVTSLNNFFSRLGFCLAKIEHVDTHGGSIRAYITRNSYNIDNSVSDYLMSEKKFGIEDIKTYDNFYSRIKKSKENVRNNLQKMKDLGYTICGYGSPAKATTSLNYFGIDRSYIDYIIEDNVLKHGKFMPGVNIPILAKDELKKHKPNVIVVMAWNFFEEIKKSNKNLIDSGIKFVSIKDLQKEIKEP